MRTRSSTTLRRTACSRSTGTRIPPRSSMPRRESSSRTSRSTGRRPRDTHCDPPRQRGALSRRGHRDDADGIAQHGTRRDDTSDLRGRGDVRASSRATRGRAARPRRPRHGGAGHVQVTRDRAIAASSRRECARNAVFRLSQRSPVAPARQGAPRQWSFARSAER